MENTYAPWTRSSRGARRRQLRHQPTALKQAHVGGCDTRGIHWIPPRAAAFQTDIFRVVERPGDPSGRQGHVVIELFALRLLNTTARDFEEARQRLKKRCPARYADVSCTGQDQCPVAQGIRIPLDTDRRIFTPVDRTSYTWEREYAHRTAVERVNSRLDVSFGFELHTIRG